MDPLHQALRKVRFRMSVQQWLSFTCVGLIASASAACLWLIVTRLFPLVGDPIPIAGVLLGLGVVAATAWAVYQRYDSVKAALETDKRLGLKERLTSSLELEDVDHPMVLALHADARNHLNRLDLHRDFAFQTPDALRWLTIPIVLFGILYIFLPEFDLFGFKERQVQAKAQQERVKMQVERIRAEARPLKEETAKLDAASLEEAADFMDNLAKMLELGQINEKQALAKLTSFADSLKERYQGIQEDNPTPKLVGSVDKLGAAKDLANDIKDGNFGDAAKKVNDMQKKLLEGNLSEEEKEDLAKDLEKLAKMLGDQNSDLAKALAKAAAGLQAQNVDISKEALEAMAASLQDLESAMKQLEQLEKCMACMGKAGQSLDKDARIAALGQFREGGSERFGPGMGGPGRGRGGEVGELPDVNAGMKPEMLPGEVGKGKLLMSIQQQGAPEENPNAAIELIQGAFVEASQEAERALEQEEIPRGSQEFVRRYFGTLEQDVSASSVSGAE